MRGSNSVDAWVAAEWNVLLRDGRGVKQPLLVQGPTLEPDGNCVCVWGIFVERVEGWWCGAAIDDGRS